MISPWEVYFILQLDEIRGMFTFFAFMLGVGCFIAFFAGAILRDNYPEHPSYASGKRLHDVIVPRLFFALLVCGAINSFIPSTKTMAAVVILPAIVNNETVQKEAGDLYALAKQGLKELVTPDEPPTEEKRNE